MHVQADVATDEDVGMLVELYRAYRDSLVSERGGATYVGSEAFAEPLKEHFHLIVHDSRWLVLVGRFEDAPVGLAAARLDPMADSSYLATVEVLYVDPAAREVGVGEQLVNDVVQWAEQRGASGIDVRVLPGMRASKNFLESSSFVARLLVMHRRLLERHKGGDPEEEG